MVSNLVLLFRKTKKVPVFTETFFSRGGQIRTDDLLVPNEARYRATLHPELLKKLRMQI
jgi:hypothetical protein